jgi:hypothetical protein
MRRITIIASVSVVLMAAGIGCSKNAATDTNATEQAVKKQTICPVMGGEVNKKLFVDADGKRIYVCCGDCIATVKKDPAKYIAQLEKEGVVLEKIPSTEPASPSK